jgi:hypothetical protein
MGLIYRKVACPLYPHFVTADQLTEAAALIDDLRDEGTKQVALSELAAHAVSYDLSRALRIADLCDFYFKPRTLERISFMMLETDLESAKKIAESIEHFPSQIGALASIASHTHDEEAVDELISIAEINEKLGRGCDDWEVLSNIACSIAKSFPEKAIGLLKDIQVNQVNAIIDVALNLTDTDRAMELIRTSLRDDGVPELSFAVGAMALKLAKTDRQKAMELVEEIQDEYEKEQVLLSLT